MKKKQFLSTVMSAACLVCMPLVPLVTSAAASTPVAAGYTVSSGTLTVAAGYAYTPTISASGKYTETYSSVTLGDGSSLGAPVGYLVTLVVDGVETEITDDTTYSGTVVLAYTPLMIDNSGDVTPNDDTDDTTFTSYTGGDDEDYYFRTALYIDASGVDTDKSVSEVADYAGTYDTTNGGTADGLDIESTSPNFNGIMVVGSGAEYTVQNSTFNMLGDSDGDNDICDFTGRGAALGAYDGAKLTIDNCTINTTGVARLSLMADNGSNVLIEDSSYDVAGGDLYDDYISLADQSKMVAPPWVLGITGNARGTNLEGELTSTTFVRVDGKASQWGVVSTDAASGLLLNVIDMDMTLTDVDDDDPFTTNYGSGYGTYAIGYAHENFYGVHMYVGTYATIVTVGDCVYQSSNFSDMSVYPISALDTDDGSLTFSDTPVFTGIDGEGRNTVIHSDAFGFMFHVSGGSVDLTDNTEVYTNNAVFLHKAGDADITVEDGSTVEAEDGVLLQMIDNDDDTVGMDTSTLQFNTEFNEAAGYPGIDYDVTDVDYTSKDDAVTFTAADVTLTGNIYNGSGYFNGDSPDSLVVTLKDKASLTGDIAATSYIHVDENGDQNTYFTVDQYYYLGHVADKVNYNGGNDIAVTLKSGSTWTVSKESYITSLTVEDGATLNASSITVDGTHYTVDELVKAGTVTGKIILTKSSILDYLPSILAAAKKGADK